MSEKRPCVFCGAEVPEKQDAPFEGHNEECGLVSMWAVGDEKNIKTPKDLAELEERMGQLFPGCRVEVDHLTWEVIIRTGKYLANGDASNTLFDEWKDLSGR